MNKKLYTTTYKFLDTLVLLTMILAAPFNMSAAYMDQMDVPVLSTDKADYAPGESAFVTGTLFTPGDYVLSVNSPTGPEIWGMVTADAGGGFAVTSPALNSAGIYELMAIPAGGETPSASVIFTVTEPAPPAEEPASVLIPFIQSDKTDYAPGELVTITGGNWQGDMQVRIYVNDDVGQTWSRDVLVDVAADGTIFDQFNLPTWFVATYVVVGGGQQTGRTVTTTFTDEELSWDQCQNDTNPTDNVQDPCAWTNGALNANNSIYAEGDVVPQRHIRGVSSAGSHYTMFDHSFYDQAKDAYTYDFWATPDFTVGDDLNPCNELASSLGLTLSQCDALFAARQSVPIPTESTYTIGASTYTYPFIAGAEANAALDGVTRNLWISCGTSGGTKLNPTFTTGTCSNIAITILGHGNSNKDLLLASEQQGPPTADEFVQMKVDYTTPANTYVAIWVGGHLAKNSYWNEPDYITNSAFQGYGSSYSSGASFHQRLIGWDLRSAIGNRDNQIQSSGDTVVPPGSITIIKDDTSDSGTSFDFTASSPLLPATFSLSDDGVNAIGENMQAFSNLFTSTYTINELEKAGWDLTNVVCTGTTSSYIYSDTGVDINLQPGDNVTCTFTNSPMGGLDVTKTANTSLTRTYSWSIDKTADGEYWKFIGDAVTAHPYTVSVNKTAVDSNWAVSGNITITNNAPVAANITGVTDVISNDIAATVSCPVTFPYTLASGGTLTCSYTSSLPDASDRINTATVTTSGVIGGGTTTADVSFANATVTEGGYSSINVTDTNGEAWAASDDASWGYSKDFACPTDPSLYTNGVYIAEDAVNTATITETGASDTATVKLHCYAPLVSKTAAGGYDRSYSWDITKGPDGEYNRFAGESATHGYTVAVDQTITDSAYLVAGTITVSNPNPNASMTVNVADSVAGVDATLACDGTLTVPAGGTSTCDYTAILAAPTNGTNTATVTLNTINFTATKDYTFTEKTLGSPTIGVTDTNGKTWLASKDENWNYNEKFTCSSNAADYTNGTYDIVHTNTASIDGTDKSADATVTVHCYIPLVSKTASASYDERHTWNITKTVTPASQNGFAGDNLSWLWTVNLSESFINENFAVTGIITVTNPAPMPMTVALADVLDDETAATITADDDCAFENGQLTIPANGTATCGYTAAPSGMTATKNTATVTMNEIPFLADAAINFVKNVINGSAAVTDTQIGLNTTVEAGGTYGPWTKSYDHTCSANFADYGEDGKYSGGANNTATVTASNGQTDSASASTAFNCYAPLISKTAAGTYDERHEWDVEKTVTPASQSGFAGDTLPFTWTITVTEDVFEENFNVAGTITVVNPAPMTMTVDLADTLDVAATVTITADDACDFTDGKLTIPANSTATCGYTSAPAGRTATLNTATATLNEIPFSASDAVEWTSDIIRGEAKLTDLQGPLSETITESGTWTIEDNYTCSTDTTKYTSNYSYTESILNTAVVTSESKEEDRDTATETIGCYIPEVSKTAAGTYGERHEWDVTKTVNPVSQSAFAGDTVSYEWTVVVTEQTFEENFVVGGKITVVNHNPEDAMTVALSDVVDGVPATITACTGDADLTNGLTVAAGGSAECDYIVGLTELSNRLDAPTSNTATAVLNAVSYTATDPIEWTPSITRASVTLSDDQNPNLPSTITDGGTWKYLEQYTCSSDKALYEGDSTYIFGESNTATLTSGDFTDSSSADTTVNCYVPTIMKNANGSFDEVHDWEVYKTVNTASQTAFAGEKKNFTWTVRVDETTHGENYNVTGQITIINPNPEDALIITLNDKLDDGSTATITTCVGGTWSAPTLTVPAGGTATCDYAVTPKGDMAKFAAALPASVTINSANPGPESYWLTTVSNDAALNGVYEAWCVDIDRQMTPGTNYTATVYSSYEAYPTSLIEKYYNMDLVNWLINQDFVGKSAAPLAGNYTYGDVQRAIWELIEDNPTATTAGLGTFSQPHVDQLETLAKSNGEGFVPTCGDFVAVLLVPTGGQQPIAIAQVTFASLGIDCTDSNVATAVLNGIEFPASAQILWTINKINETAALDDDQKTDWPTTVSADSVFTYQDPQGYTCSVDPAAYTNGYYQYNENNTAVLTYSTGSDTATASTAVKCYAPVISKTAAGAYDERHEWDVEKSVTPLSQDILAGNTGDFEWTVTVTESITEESFAVNGSISIKNPRTDATMVVNLSDVLNDGSTATITGCTVGTWNGTNQTVSIPANSTAVCSYTAAPSGRTATLNTATVKLNALTTTATANLGWTANVIRASATLDDDQNPDFPLEITESGTWIYSDSYTCSTQQGDYINGSYKHPEANTATVTSGDKSDSSTANTSITCYAPVVTKDVTTYFNRDWDWTITKDADASYDLFAGEDVTHGYKVTVTPTYEDNFWGVKGTITVTNPHPTQDMVLTGLTDLAGGINGVVTCPSLKVPAAGSLSCTYDTGPQTAPDANPFGDFNTATAVFAAANWTGSAPINFSANPTTEDEPVITVDDNNLTDEVWSADRAYAEWTYTKDFACSTNPADYKDGKYSYDLTNTATINQTGQKETATVDVNCYAPKVTKVAQTYFNRDWDWSVTKDYDSSYNLFAGEMVTHGYKVNVTPTYIDNFWGVNGTITVYNYHPTKDMTLTSLLDLAGGINGNVTCDSLIVPAAGSLTCKYDTGAQDSPDENPFGSLNTATASFAGVEWIGTAGILFSSTPTTEDEPVITVDDDNLTGETWSANRVAGEWTYTEPFACSTNLADYTDGKYSYSHTNTAKINETGQTDTAKVDVTCYAPLVSKTAAGTYDERHEWDVTKTVTPASQNIFASATADFNWTVKVKEVVVEENFVVKGVITVINPAPMPMVANLTDVLGDGTAVTINPSSSCAYNNGTLTIPASSTATCDYSAKLSYTDDTAAAKSNTGEVTLNGLTVPATASIAWTATIIRSEATLTDVQKPLNELLKSAGPFPGTFDYEFTYADSYTCSSDVSKYNASGTYKETINNTATVSSGDKTDFSTASTSVNCYIPTISKTARPTFTRTFLWDISKSVDKTLVKQVGGSAVFNYTVAVNETGYTDSLWKVTGKITIVNPNPSAPITVNVTDAVNNGGICTVASGTNVTVGAGQSSVFDYTCDFAEPPTSYQGVNTVTAEWVSESTASQFVSNTAAFAFDTGLTGNPTNVNKTITVKDTFNGSTTTLGTVTATTSIPYTSKVFTYSRTVAIPTYNCKTYPNTAKIVETNQTASQTIKVCGPINLGGKTIGFWQNKNGQDIINKAGVTTGTTTCKLTPWLRGFAPFQDLNASASCTTVAAYTTNIIKAANASGASMNAMLKAQMLATALDVYFSDPLLGGNKIGALAPIGGQTIDLTKVKAGSGYQNVSGAFGGVTSMPVSQMLTYAASQSNVGGTTWYSNIKTTQEKAKNAFDAINNSWVFAP